MSRRIYALALVVTALALVAAGCGSGGSSESSGGGAYSGKGGGGSAGGGETTSASSKSEGGGGSAVVSLGSVQKLGMVLVDSNGMTLYDFHKDKGTTSSCYGPCAQAWPPLTTEGEPQVGNGASASKLGTSERNDGTAQVTYAGHPLYLFVEDQKPGEANGNDVSAFGAQWYALTGSGSEPGD